MAASPKPADPSLLYNRTLRSLPWAYILLTAITPATLISSPNRISVDEITVRTRLTTALSVFLGLTGTTVPIDILKLEGRDVWIRVPAEDASAVVEAASSWTGNDLAWRIKASGTWLGGASCGTGTDLFEDS